MMRTDSLSIEFSYEDSRAGANKSNMFRCVNIIFLFLYVFQPKFSRLSIMHALTLYMAVFILYDSFARTGGKLTIDRDTAKCLHVFLPFIIYVTADYIVQSAISDHSGLILHNLIIFYLVLVRVILSIEYLRHLMMFHGYSADDLMNDFIMVAILQLACVMAAFANPDIRAFFNNLTLRYGDSAFIAKALEHDIWRSFGFAGNIFDAFGYLTALLIVITFARGMEKQSLKMIVLSVVMFLMPFLNARTGVYLAVGGIAIVFVFIRKRINASTLIKYFFAVMVSIIAVRELYSLLPDATKSWIEVGLNSTRLLLSGGGRVGVYEEILQNNFRFPDNVLFGAAMDPGDILSRGIESGYVQCIWRFGIAGTLLMFAGFLYIFARCFMKSKRSLFRAVTISYAAIFFVYLIKLFSIYSTGANIMIIGLPVMMACEETKSRRILH
ncbi:hypothetical protein D3Z50_09465 [Clostridiaceae bacterium]|nr:hypothetical protein [Clostridiaceae bacterium]